MKKESLVRKNLDLLDEFMKYAFDHPDILDEIPQNASVVLLPDGDPSVEKENKRMSNKLKAKGGEVVVMKLKATKRRVSKV